MVTLLRAEAAIDDGVVGGCWDSDRAVVNANGLRDRFEIPLSVRKKIQNRLYRFVRTHAQIYVLKYTRDL